MSGKAVFAVLFAVALAVGGYFAYQDFQFRQVNGRVVDVSTFSWGQEVDQVSDDRPVLVHFYVPNAPGDQDKVVASIAWSYAGDVKVVRVNGTRIENIPLEIGYNIGSHPSFIVLHKNKVVRGPEGRPATRSELKQLIQAARQP